MKPRVAWAVGGAALITAGLAAVPVVLVVATGSQGQYSQQRSDVINPGEFADELSSCLKREDGQDAAGCVNLVVDTALERDDIYAALGVIRTASEQDQRYVALCHDSSHKAGLRAVENGMTLEDAYGIEFPDCRFGFYHGALTQSTLDLSLDQLTQNITQLCSFFGGAQDLKAQECTHAVGHLLVDRVGVQAGTALESCRRLDQDALVGRCVDGAMMQLMELTREGSNPGLLRSLWGTTREDNSAAIAKLCSPLEGAPGRACWNNLPQLLAQLWGADYEAIAHECANLPPNWDTACFEGIAASAFLAYGWDTSKVLRACYAHEGQGSRDCVRSAAYTVGLQATNEIALETCRRVKPADQEACSNGISQGMRARTELSQ